MDSIRAIIQAAARCYNVRLNFSPYVISSILSINEKIGLKMKATINKPIAQKIRSKLNILTLDILLSRTLKKSIPILLKLGLNSSMILKIMFENVLKSFKQN